MNTPDYLSLLRQKKAEKNAHAPNRENRENGLRGFLGYPSGHKKSLFSEPAPMTAEEEKAIRGWLDHYRERDQAMIDGLLEECQQCLKTRQYYMDRWDEIQRQQPAVLVGVSPSPWRR